MMKIAQFRRLAGLALLLVLAFVGLGWRLVDLQILTADVAIRQFEERATIEVVEIPWRGDILDRNGGILTTSLRRYHLAADPSFNGRYYPEIAAALAPVLEVSHTELLQKLTPVVRIDPDTGKPVTNKWVRLAEEIPEQKLIEVREALQTIGGDVDLKSLPRKERELLRAVRLKGAYSEAEVQTRQYPNGNLAAQILGIVNSSAVASGSGSSHQIQVGVDGIEGALNKYLTGTIGHQRLEKTELVPRVTRQLPAVDGMNIFLTIDRRIQEMLERELVAAHNKYEAVGTFGVVMDVDTFEVLAIGSSPSFDPTDRKNYNPNQTRLQPLTVVFEPGSIIKTIPVAAALEEGLVGLETPIFCENGTWFGPAVPLRDTHPYGNLSVKQVVQKSSNIGTAKISEQLGPRRLYDYLLKFGLNAKTGIGIYEEQGLLRPYADYKPVDFTRLPIGYASGVTQLQMACVYSAIANGGMMKRPRILQRIEDRSGTVLYPDRETEIQRVVSPETSARMMEALASVTETGGTATTARMKYYKVAGKTGTAHKYSRNGGYNETDYYASFVGVFPASDPRICIAITVDCPNKTRFGYYGGQVAGPVFTAIAEQLASYYNLTPDKTTSDEQLVSLVSESAAREE